MIDSTIEKLAFERSAQLEQLGIFAAPRAGTPLEVLVSELLPGSDLGNLYASEGFTNRLSSFADELADNTRRYLDFSRNTAKQAITDVQERVQKAIETITVDPFAGINVVELSLPSLLGDSDFMSRVTNSNLSSIMPKITPKFTERTDAQLLELCSTGNTGWDEGFNEWLKKQPEGSLQMVWQSVFQDPGIARTISQPQSLDALVSDYSDGKCSALIIFLMAQRLTADIGDDCGMDLDTARRVFFALSAKAANNLLRAVDWYNSFVSTNTLVADTRMANKIVRVNSEVFKNFQAEGGNVEVVLGMLISGKSYNTVKQINENAEELLKAWNDYTLSRTEASQAEYELNVRGAMLVAFEASLATPFSDAEADTLSKPGTRENAMRIFREELQNASREQIHKNWVDVLWRATCKARFYYFTFVYDLLDSIDYGVRDQGLDAESATHVATRKIVAQFVNEQMVAV